MKTEEETQTYKLKHPVGNITELVLRTKPTFKDYFGVKASKDGEIDIKSIAVLISNLSNQPLEVIGKLHNDDWQDITKGVGVFF